MHSNHQFSLLDLQQRHVHAWIPVVQKLVVFPLDAFECENVY